jgi:hypothetical protein
MEAKSAILGNLRCGAFAEKYFMSKFIRLYPVAKDWCREHQRPFQNKLR